MYEIRAREYLYLSHVVTIEQVVSWRLRLSEAYPLLAELRQESAARGRTADLWIAPESPIPGRDSGP